MPKLSVVIPFYNEAENLPRIYQELDAVRKGALARYDFEVVLMDNHSTDDSFNVASRIAEKDPAVKVIRLSRNFGYQANILTGLHSCTGDAAIQLDADGEDDPALIPRMVEHWEQGYKVVYGVRRTRHEGALRVLQRKIFYRLISFLSSIPIPLDAGDFRLMDRCVLESLRGLKESSPYIRGLISFIGYEQMGFVYDRRPRYKGESKFSWWDYMRLALAGISSFSAKPLYLATWLGLALAGCSFLGAFAYLYVYFFVGVPVQGFTTLILVQLFLAGIQLLCLGITGQYIGGIFEEVKARPRSIVERTFPPQSGKS